jgi:hypothetical protein
MMLLWAALWINDVYAQIKCCPCIGPGLIITPFGLGFSVGVFVGLAVATFYFMSLAKAAPRDTPTSTVTEKKKE